MKFTILTLATLSFFLGGCATIVNGSRQSVGINSSPNGAYVKVDGVVIGRTPWTGKIPRQESLPISVEKSGYEGQILTLTGETSGWVLGNIFTMGVLGTTTDITSGGAYQYEPGSYHVALEKTEAPEAVRVVDKKMAAVKVFVLANHANLRRQFMVANNARDEGSPQNNDEHLVTLKQLMGADQMSNQEFRTKFAIIAESAGTADAMAEALIANMEPAQGAVAPVPAPTEPKDKGGAK